MNQPRPYDAREETAHSATHGIGVVASVIGIVALVATASMYGNTWQIVGGAVFGISALLMFLTSVLYHAARRPEAKNVLRKLDHSAIYVLIAGTYTAFTIGVMRGLWGWSLFGVIWSIAVLGIVVEMTTGRRHPVRSSALYIAMGWIGIVAIKPLVESLTASQLAWVLAGGLFYTLGVPFYIWKSRPYTHAVWHLFVLAGAGCHFVAVLSAMRYGMRQ